MLDIENTSLGCANASSSTLPDLENLSKTVSQNLFAQSLIFSRKGLLHQLVSQCVAENLTRVHLLTRKTNELPQMAVNKGEQKKWNNLNGIKNEFGIPLFKEYPRQLLRQRQKLLPTVTGIDVGDFGTGSTIWGTKSKKGRCNVISSRFVKNRKVSL